MRLPTSMLFEVWITKGGNVGSVPLIHNYSGNMRVSSDRSRYSQAIRILLIDTDNSSDCSPSQTPLFREGSDYLFEHLPSALVSSTLV